MRSGFTVTTQKPSFSLRKASAFTKAQEELTSLWQCESDANLFFDSCGIVHYKYAAEGQTIKSITWRFYVALMMLCKESSQRCGQLRIGNFTMTMLSPILPRYSNFVLAKNDISFVQQPLNSSDLAPCDIWLFPWLKTTLKGLWHDS